MSEAQFQRKVEQLCKMLGLLWYHTYNSQRSNKGFPDMVIFTKSGKLIYRELKTTKGRTSPEQKVWLDRLTAAGCDAGIWRPEDFDRIHEELAA